MKKLHIALSVSSIDESIKDYTRRLGAKPCVVVDNQYALWRTDSLNFSIRSCSESPGTLRHLGFEDPSALAFDEEKDVNDIVWERFTAEQQSDEILSYWPEANFNPE